MKKESMEHDAAWLSSSTGGVATQLGVLSNGSPIAGQALLQNSDLNGESNFVGNFWKDEVAIVDRALRANGLERADVSLEGFGCLLEQARR